MLKNKIESKKPDLCPPEPTCQIRSIPVKPG